MYERGAGKIVVFGSATGVKAMEQVSAYSSARFAQVGYVNAVGIEAYFPPEFTATEEFKEHLKQVPAGRLATAREDALFALFLASNESDFFVGQAIPFSGGWVQ
jgi:NAD(P)-dependent dehydrogenase (short-subunit alcohol dehydrogenase family)